VYRIARSKPWPPSIDLSTVRETLVYMKDDMARDPELLRIRTALEIAIGEIDRAEQTPRAAVLSPLVARFLPARRRR
jgi:hypothetical protein